MSGKRRDMRHGGRTGIFLREWVVPAAACALIFAAAGCAVGVDDEQRRTERLAAAGREYEVARNAPAPEEALDCAAAVAFAMRNNLSLRVAELENAIQRELRYGAVLRALPSVKAGYDTSYRDRPNASRSVGLASGSTSLEPSYSTPQHPEVANVSALWNLLDFGMSVYRTRQRMEREHLGREQRRRARQQVAFETAEAYWQAVAAEATAREAEPLERLVRDRIDAIRADIAAERVAPAAGARQELTLLQQWRTLKQYGRTARTARTNLARVMGAADADALVLAAFPEGSAAPPPPAGAELTEWQRSALTRRPELWQQDAQARISLDEARAALLSMLPTPAAMLRFDHDSNPYLTYDQWRTVGLNVVWDALSIPAKVHDRRAATRQAELASRRGEVLAAGVLVQVRLAALDCAESEDRVRLAREIVDARERIVRGAQAGVEAGAANEGEALPERLALVVDRAEWRSRLADGHIARARLENAAGLDPEDDREPLSPPAAEDMECAARSSEAPPSFGIDLSPPAAGPAEPESAPPEPATLSKAPTAEANPASVPPVVSPSPFGPETREAGLVRIGDNRYRAISSPSPRE